MMEIAQEKIGLLQIVQEMPPDLKPFGIKEALPIVVVGEGIKTLFQEFRGEGFSAWYSRYWTTAPVVLSARDNGAILELRISLKNVLRGTWDKIPSPELQPHYFQMGYVPHTLTRAVFAGSAEFQTFDIHFDADFIRGLGLDYKTLDVFLRKAEGDQPAELSAVHHPCSPIMLDAVHHILVNQYTKTARERLLRIQVENILLAALEISRPDKLKVQPLSSKDIEALHHVRTLIELACPEYPGNDVLIRKTNLNGFKLNDGFPRLFGMSPFAYHQQLRFEQAKQLLRENYTVVDVGNILNYDSPTTFIRMFRKRFGMTPKQWQKGRSSG
jgi:AraC-like DNA-binding protein